MNSRPAPFAAISPFPSCALSNSCRVRVDEFFAVVDVLAWSCTRHPGGLALCGPLRMPWRSGVESPKRKANVGAARYAGYALSGFAVPRGRFGPAGGLRQNGVHGSGSAFAKVQPGECIRIGERIAESQSQNRRGRHKCRARAQKFSAQAGICALVQNRIVSRQTRRKPK